MIALDCLGVNKLFNNCLFYGEFSGQLFIRKIGVIETEFLSLAVTLDWIAQVYKLDSLQKKEHTICNQME